MSTTLRTRSIGFLAAAIMLGVLALALVSPGEAEASWSGSWIWNGLWWVWNWVWTP